MKRLLTVSTVVLAVSAVSSVGAVASAQSSQQPVRVGGSVTPPERIRYAAPAYPDLARAANVSGVVIVEALIDQQGAVSEARVLKSIPLLDEAALDAVKQWRYTPTLMNGVAVPVILTTTVAFSDESGAPAGGTMLPPISFGGASAAASSALPSTWNDRPVVRIGGDVAAPERIKYVAAVYPPDALNARVSGVVVVEALIDDRGNVTTAQVLKSIPLLDQAALDAVMQWKYAPTMLNGVAVPVRMTVTVNFTPR